MLLSAVSVLVVGQSSSEIPEGLMNNSVYKSDKIFPKLCFWTNLEKRMPYINFSGGSLVSSFGNHYFAVNLKVLLS